MHTRFPLVRALRPRLALSALLPLAAGLFAGEAEAQFLFSVDWQSETKSQSASVSGQAITEGDVLVPGPGAPDVLQPLQRPAIAFDGAEVGIQDHGNCVGQPAGTPCGIDLDGLSGGHDAPFQEGGFLGVERGKLWFSTDEWAVSKSGMPTPPNVFSEAAPGAEEISADVWCDLGLPTGPLGPTAAISGHSGVFDGDGLRSATGRAYYGLGLVEVNRPMPGVPDEGDNLDALDIGTLVGGGFPAGGLYYTLDSAFLDPLEGVANSGSAAAAGFSGGDVLFQATSGGTTTLYAPAPLLGLDLAGVDSDDLDALILTENGMPGYQPSAVAYDWTSGSTDMLLFSVRRGSTVVGLLDSRFGAPIEPGDILSTPLSAANGGTGSPAPSIFIAAEVLGLATSRTNGVPFGDDLNAMDKTASPETCYDCNNNGVEDSVDIATGASLDKNFDGIPDECQDIFAFCPGDGTRGACPCGNESATNSGEGCEHSQGHGAVLDWTGTSSVAIDDLAFTVTQARPSQPGMFVQGASHVEIPFKDGFLCLGGPTERLEVAFTSGAGSASSTASIVTAGNVSIGDERFYQFWFRDPVLSPCGTGSNFSSAVRVPWQ